MNNELHVILGTGPVGCWTARSLRAMGYPVRAVNRTGNRPDLLPPEVEVVRADISDVSAAKDAARGASVVYQALNPPYHQWAEFFPALQVGAMAAARSAGAKFVSIENLYLYDSSASIDEGSPIMPRSNKGELRRKMAEEVMTAHERGTLRTTALRSSDYYGPGVVASAFGSMVFGNLVAGKRAQVSGSKSMPHSFAYIEDVGRAAAMLGTRDEALGRAWIAPHASPLTQGEMVELICKRLGIAPRITVITPMLMRLAGLFIPAAGASVEMLYEFTAPFVVGSTLMQRRFGVPPTPVETGIERTLQWFRNRENGGR